MPDPRAAYRTLSIANIQLLSLAANETGTEFEAFNSKACEPGWCCSLHIVEWEREVDHAGSVLIGVAQARFPARARRTSEIDVDSGAFDSGVCDSGVCDSGVFDSRALPAIVSPSGRVTASLCAKRRDLRPSVR